MVSLFDKVYNFRAYDFDEEEIVKLKIGNLSCFLAITISTFYTFIYFFYFEYYFAAVVNQFFGFLYLYYFYLLKEEKLLKARLFFFMVFLIHILVIVVFFASSRSGLHFYYILSVPAAFLFFTDKQVFMRYIIPSLAFISFSICYFLGDYLSSFNLAKSHFDLMFTSNIACVFIVLAIVMTIFQNELKKKQEKLEELSKIDTLTQIYNRRAFYFFAEEMMKYSKRYKSSFGLIIFDIDFFKKINDEYGHDVGDVVLKTIADEVLLNLRETDRFARFGGEEFVILLQEITRKDIVSFAQKIRKVIEDIETYNIDKKIKLSASFGVSLFKKDDAIVDLIKRADQAMYKAKKTGRNKICSQF